MAFIAKQPTYHNEITKYRQTAGVWAANGTVTGQVYTPLRNQDDEEGGLLYFMYPVASAAALRDDYDGAGDTVAITYPGGSVKGYHVREILPRWLGFPNQHLIAVLQRLSAEEFNAVLTSVAGGTIVPPEGVLMAEGTWLTATPESGAGFTDWDAFVNPIGQMTIPAGTPKGALVRFTDLDCSLPEDAVIVGLEQPFTVQDISPAGDYTADAFDRIVRLSADHPTFPFVANKINPTAYPNTAAAFRLYGGPADLWDGNWTRQRVIDGLPHCVFAPRRLPTGAADTVVEVTVHNLRVYYQFV